MLKMMRDNSITMAAYEKLPLEKTEGKIIRGILKKEIKPEYTAAYSELCVKAKGGKNG